MASSAVMPGLWLFSAVFSVALISGTAAATPPNIMLVVADDLGYNDVDFQSPNNSVVLTPHLRQLATNGIRLANHHVQPFCSPTRATLMTGRHVLRYGLQNTVIWPQDAWAIPLNETFLSRNLQDAGYYTAYFGKWHLGLYKKDVLPLQRGYNEQYGYYLGGEDYFDHTRDGALDWHRNDTLEIHENGTYSADLIGNVAVDFIHRRANKGPWFMYLPFQSVHAPLEAEQVDLDRYPNLDGSVKTRAAMVSSMDTNIGRVVEALNSTGQLDDFVMVFTADNGAPWADAFSMGDDPAMIEALGLSDQPSRPPAGMHGAGGGSNYPLSGWKHWVFEGGVRSASFVYSSLIPQSTRGSVHHGLFHSVDWLPTLTSLAGASTAKNLPLDGMDIWQALLDGGRTSPRDEIPVNIAACGGDTKYQSIVDGPQAALILGDLKVIVQCWWRDSKNASTAQLYNITEDIAEVHDLASSRPDDVQRLLARLSFWEEQSVPPYPPDQDHCGQGKGQGPSPESGGNKYWDAWC